MSELEDLILQLAKELEHRRYGKYRGFVSDNEDPDYRGRVKLTVPSVLGDQETDWALPCMPFGGRSGEGFFTVPEVEAQVWVEFEEGDINRPLWVGTFWRGGEVVPESAAKQKPTTRVLQTPAGHLLQFDDEEGQESIRLKHSADADLLIEADGSIKLTDASGNTLHIDATAEEVTLEHSNGSRLNMNQNGTFIEEASGNRIDMDASGIAVEGHRVIVKGGQVSLGDLGGEPLIKGQSFLTMFMTHRHTVAPLVGGPTSPPVPQGEMSTLSTKVSTT